MKIEFRNSKGVFYYFDVRTKSATVGRSRKCDITLVDDSISREHLVINILETDDVTVSDLGSANGTFVNETKIQKDVPEAFSPLFNFVLGNGVQMRLLEESETFPDGAEISYVRKKEKIKLAKTTHPHLQTMSNSSTYKMTSTRKTNFNPRAEKADRKKEKKTGMSLLRVVLIILAAITVYLFLSDM